MRNYRKLICFVLFTILIVLVAVYSFPRKIYREYSGVMYRTGDTTYSEKVKVKIDGYLSKGLLKGDKFKGAITIGDKQLTKINMGFDKLHRGSLFYYDENRGDYRLYGDLISSNMEDEFTICVLEENKQKNGSSSWSSKDGLMVSAPANLRNEALDISNTLMEDILVNNKLK